jgi:hypothetical protein
MLSQEAQALLEDHSAADKSDDEQSVGSASNLS